MPIRGKQAEHLLAFFWMTTDGLPVAYRGQNKGRAEVRYLSISSREDDKLSSAEKTSDKASSKEMPSIGRQLNRPSAWEEFSKIFSTHQAPWKSHFAGSKVRDLEMTSTSTKLTKGRKLPSTNIRNEYEDILLKQKDVRRWQMAEDLLTEELSRRSNDWQATITDRSRNWPSIDLDAKNIDWRLLLAFNASGVLYGGLHVLAWGAKFATWQQEALWRIASVFVIGFCTCINHGAADGEPFLRRGRCENGRALGHGRLFQAVVSV